MPSSPAGYDYPPLAKLYDAKLLALFQESLERAAPRTRVAVLERHVRGDPEHLAPAVRRRHRDP